MITRPLALHEQAAHRGMTHMSIVTADDLTNTTAAAAQTITLATLVAGDIIGAVEDNVVVNFGVYSGAGVLDTTFNTTTRSVGDNTGVATHLAAAEANANGAVVKYKYSNTAVGPYTAANTVTVTFNSMAAKALSTINRGELHVFFSLLRASQISQANTASAITTK